MISEAELAFLRTRLDEDEAAARIISDGGFAAQRWETEPPRQVNPESHPASDAISNALGLDWHERPCGWVALYAWERLNDEPAECDARQWDAPVALVDSGRRQFAHIARHDPERALREVGTWRRLMLEYQSAGMDAKYKGTGRETGFRLALSAALRLKAHEYREHPDYEAANEASNAITGVVP